MKSGIDWVFTFKIIIIILIIFLVTTSCQEVIVRTFFDYFELDKEKTSSWVYLALCSIILLLCVMLILGIEMHDLFGISEVVDTLLTNKIETINKGILVHSISK